MMQIIRIMIIVTVAISYAGCGGKKKVDLTASGKLKDMPDWYINPPPGENDIIYGTGRATSRDVQLAVNKAALQAERNVAGNLNKELESQEKNFVEEIAQDADSELTQTYSETTEAIVKETLSGLTREKQEVVQKDNIITAYVLVSLDMGAANQRLVEKIKADKLLNARLRSTDAFQELERKTKDK